MPARGAGAFVELLAAVRSPFTFVARNPQAARRVSIPTAGLAARARAWLSGADDATASLLTELCDLLEKYEATATETRSQHAERCLALVEALELCICSEDASDVQAGKGRAGGGGASCEYCASKEDPTFALQQLGKPIQFLRGVGPQRAEILRKFGITAVGDLLYHLPFRYEDRRRIRKIADLCIGETASVIGELTHVAERTVGRAQRRILDAVVRDDSGLLGLTWYNQLAYFRKRLRTGLRCLVHGRVERAPGGGKRIVHPELDSEPDEGSQGILPVYNKPTAMTVGSMRKLVQQAVRDFAHHAPSVLPASVARRARILDLTTALRRVHLPGPDADIGALESFSSPAHRSIVFDELFYLQLGMALRRRAVTREPGIAFLPTGDLTARLERMLPFELTGAQRRVLEEIYADMAAPHPMHRLLQGDVGSGKTIVALFAALVTVGNGFQAAFMAPTELLAEQHFQTIERFVTQLGIRTVLLTGDVTRAQRKEVYAGLSEGTIPLVIGTHALIQEGVRFRRLGLGIIDEQHRFGVLQRAALRKLGDGARMPDMLLMSATPIPRTLALTVYGDLDISVLDELPPGRRPVRTVLAHESERTRVYQLVRRELERGRQGYVVYPLVESSEKEDLRDATTMARELARTVFSDRRVGLVHGRMKAEEKDAVMRSFRSGELQLLVSTTVIEVGVDVPQATIMVVEHAERFGLAQLHQLRGRVGRGGDQATCVLMVPPRSGDEVYRRLRALAETNDGFQIAEIDLQLRGPGDFLGTRQSGLPDFRLADLIRDSRLLVESRRLAEEWLEQMPSMADPEAARVLTVLRHRWAGRLGLAEIG